MKCKYYRKCYASMLRFNKFHRPQAVGKIIHQNRHDIWEQVLRHCGKQDFFPNFGCGHFTSLCGSCYSQPLYGLWNPTSWHQLHLGPVYTKFQRQCSVNVVMMLTTSFHWPQWSCSKMGCNPILKWLHCGQWELVETTEWSWFHFLPLHWN